MKTKDLQAPWISKGIKKSSKRKKKLYIKFLKDESIQNEQIHKYYNIFLKNFGKKLSKHTTNLYLKLRLHLFVY